MKRIRATVASVPILLAQATPLGDTGSFSYNRLVDLAYSSVRVLLQIGELVAVGFIVFYGLRMVASRGDSVKFSAARKGLFLAFLGAIIIFGAYFIVDMVQGTVESVGR